MFATWSADKQQQLMNDVFAAFAVPVVVAPPGPSDAPDDWEIATFGGSWESALELLHEKQSAIVQRFNEVGVAAITRQDALFMYASQWLEWTAVRGFEDPDCAEYLELMEGWLVLYHALRSQFLN